jgi:hypothetical protein
VFPDCNPSSFWPRAIFPCLQQCEKLEHQVSECGCRDIALRLCTIHVVNYNSSLCPAVRCRQARAAPGLAARFSPHPPPTSCLFLLLHSISLSRNVVSLFRTFRHLRKTTSLKMASGASSLRMSCGAKNVEIAFNFNLNSLLFGPTSHKTCASFPHPARRRTTRQIKMATTISTQSHSRRGSSHLHTIDGNC